MSKLVIINDYSSLFHRDIAGCNYIHKKTIFTLIVQLQNSAGVPISLPYTPLNVFVRVELQRESDKTALVHGNFLMN